MLNNKIIVFILCCLLLKNSLAQQACTTLGQNPSTAFPVCGTDTFNILSVPTCGGRLVNAPCALPITDLNPFWYKFTCFTGGTLGFLITPVLISDDYDWQLYDITNHNPDDVFTDKSLFVSCNWSGRTGITGTDATAANLAECDSDVPKFSKLPTLIQGHDYLLLISHFTNSQGGYSLVFNGGTASITDPVLPNLKAARAACDGTKILVKLNKQMKCSSLAADGSDFSISPAIAPITGATGINCSSGFDMDSVEISLGGILPPGNYKLRIETGTDNNNLLDNCGRDIPAGQSLPVTVFPLTPTPMDSLSKFGCAPGELVLVFRDPMKCSSIAGDGSDFIVTGSSLVSVAGAAGACNVNGLTNIIKVQLTAPIQQAGNFQIKLQTGSDGNTIINECGKETAAGAALPFSALDTVSALFITNIHFNCILDVVDYSHDGRNGVTSWRWTFDNAIGSSKKDTSLTYTVFGTKQAMLIVSNGTCSDTASSTIILDNAINAAFESTAVVCPGDPAVVKDFSTGNISGWYWTFGNGKTSIQQIPPQQFYPSSNTTRDIPVQLVVKNIAGCADTAIKTITVVGNCYIAVPKAFSPNNDGLNDYLYPTNAYKARDLLFRIYNRLGQKLFETTNWMVKWDGSFKGNPQDPGTYVWTLNYTNIDTGKRFELKGTTVLIR